MRILFINPPAREHPVVRDMAGGLGFDGGSSIVLPPLDLAYMAATLLNKGHKIKIIDADVESSSNEDIYRITGEYGPEVAVATVSLPSIYSDCLFLKGIREHTSAKVIAKTNISYPPILKELLQRSSADLCIYGECDLNIEEIISEKERKGTAYFRNDEIIIEENNFIQDLDKLPLPARQLLPNEKYRYVLLGDGVTTMQTSRGCSFPCSYYCPYPLAQGHKWRSRSPEHVVREIEDIVNKYHIQKILFRDATFTFDKERARRICELILEKGLKVNWWCETRVDCLDFDLMKKMKTAGCLGMNIGVETGDPELMKRQAKIGMTLDKLKEIRKAARELDMRLHFLLMVGLPDETKKTLYATYKLICDLRPESIGICIITPYPGTLLYNEAKQKGWIEAEEWSRFGGHYPVMHTGNLSAKDLIKAQQMMFKYFSFSRDGSLKGRLRSALMDWRFKMWVLC